MVGSEAVDSRQLNAFAAALSFFVPGSGGLINAEALNGSKEEYAQKRKFETRGMAFLVLTFLLVIINYLVFDHYKKAGDHAEEQLALSSSAMQHYNTLKLEYERRKEFLERNGLLQNARSSFYADRLAQDLPAEIGWTDLHIHPVEKKKSGDDTGQITFEGKTIMVAGNCRESSGLNEWMKQLRKKDWVQQVSLLNYKQDQAKEDGIFLLKIQVK